MVLECGESEGKGSVYLVICELAGDDGSRCCDVPIDMSIWGNENDFIAVVRLMLVRFSLLVFEAGCAMGQ